MKISEMLLPELDQEIAVTRRVLERIPGDKFEWRPHEKSTPLGYLSRHIAVLPDWMGTAIEVESWDIAPIGGEAYGMPEAATPAAVMSLLERSADHARSVISEASDEHMLKNWSLLRGGAVIFTQPRATVVRGLLNHLIHHRGQLSVYLRLNDVPVPSIY
ncbi:MAG TPA: DinB family protein, partial [Blastocatellia bacterium]|nr:DinB family protein [Blastocatellia bacterium]